LGAKKVENLPLAGPTPFGGLWPLSRRPFFQPLITVSQIGNSGFYDSKNIQTWLWVKEGNPLVCFSVCVVAVNICDVVVVQQLFPCCCWPGPSLAMPAVGGILLLMFHTLLATIVSFLGWRLAEKSAEDGN
jgi:hypothetical protein